jgi:hypothetical protein
MKIKWVIICALNVSLIATLNCQSSYNANTIPINGANCVGFGVGALFSNPGISPGSDNSAFGWESLYNVTSGGLPIRTGDANSAFGYRSLYNNTVADSNSAFGWESLYSNTRGYRNSAFGFESLNSNVLGANNAAFGTRALKGGDGNSNTAIGYLSMEGNTSSSNNAALGALSMRFLTSGVSNVAVGVETLYNNAAGSYNTGCGASALLTNNVASYNTATGAYALYNTARDNNTADGYSALFANTSGSDNTGIGYSALVVNTTGKRNTALGSMADVSVSTLTNGTAVGYGAIVNANDKIRLGDANLTICEIVNSAVYTGSDGRFKTKVSENEVKGLEFIKLLRPVAYNFDTKKFTEFNTKTMPDSIRSKHMNTSFEKSSALRQNGFIAQEVEKAAKAVGYNFSGLHVPENDNDHYSLAYSQFVVPLVKGVQEQQQIIEKLQMQLEDQKQMISDLKSKMDKAVGLNQVNKDQILAFEQNEPNPFTRETIIKYTLPTDTKDARLIIYDLAGKQVKSLQILPGSGSAITITSENLAAGMYLYTILCDGKIIESKRMIVSE